MADQGWFFIQFSKAGSGVWYDFGKKGAARKAFCKTGGIIILEPNNYLLNKKNDIDRIESLPEDARTKIIENINAYTTQTDIHSFSQCVYTARYAVSIGKQPKKKLQVLDLTKNRP